MTLNAQCGKRSEEDISLNHDVYDIIPTPQVTQNSQIWGRLGRCNSISVHPYARLCIPGEFPRNSLWGIHRNVVPFFTGTNIQRSTDGAGTSKNTFLSRGASFCLASQHKNNFRRVQRSPSPLDLCTINNFSLVPPWVRWWWCCCCLCLAEDARTTNAGKRKGGQLLSVPPGCRCRHH